MWKQYDHSKLVGQNCAEETEMPFKSFHSPFMPVMVELELKWKIKGKKKI